jgi:hypothetical protein
MMADTLSVPVGTIFYTSWGYDQTNVEWFQVTRISSSGLSVWLRPIASMGRGGREYPLPGWWTADFSMSRQGEEFGPRRIRVRLGGRVVLRIDDVRSGWQYPLDLDPGVYSTRAAGLPGH